MEKKDEYCEKIFMTLMILNDEKTRFNELHRSLTAKGAKMSKPTLIQHLNHLIEKGLVKREEEDKQKVTYVLNWNELKPLKEAKEASLKTIQAIKSEKDFKSKTIPEQVDTALRMMTIGEIFRLKYNILMNLEPENKLKHYYAINAMQRVFGIYNAMLIESCKASKKDSELILKGIDNTLEELKNH